MQNLSIKTRLYALVAFLALILCIVGAIGLNAASSAATDIEEIYEHEMIPSRELARIRRIAAINAGEVFRALQHAPSSEYMKLHNHAVNEHLEAIEKNLQWGDETWGSLKTSIKPGSGEEKLLGETRQVYEQYVRQVIRPMIASLKGGDYSTALVATFLKENREFEQKLNPLFKTLADTQEVAVKGIYADAKARNAKMNTIAISMIVGGLLFALLLATLTISSIVRPLEEMRTIIKQAATQHDFTGSISNTTGNNEISDTSRAFNDLMGTLRKSLSGLRDTIVRVDSATSSLATAAEQASIASNTSSESASAMAASVEEMSVSITSVSDSTREALDIAQEAGHRSESGGKVIDKTVSEMRNVAGLVRTISDNIVTLGQNSDRISSVVQVIRDVADQTNLLALNAAIEAARAGEAGRGFAVVADEVRKLAERTAKATSEIAEMINAIQGSARSAVNNVSDTVTQVETDTVAAQEAGEALILIRDAASNVVRVINDINDAMAEQGTASQEIARRVESVAQASEESSATVQQVADAARTIFDLSADMRRTVDQFKV